MPRLGSGQYYLPPGTTAAPDTTVESARYNIFTADIETEINQVHTDISHAADAINDPTTGLPTKVAKAGDTMTGPLVLPAAAPTLATHATNKSYVDTSVATATGVANAKVAKAGDTMTGTLKISFAGDQARFQGGSYTVIHRNDDASYYMLLTNAGDPNGTWNGLRPFTVNLGTGNISMGGTLTVTGNVQVGAPINGGSAATVTWTDANYMPRAGGTFTGAINLNNGFTAFNNSQNIYNDGCNVMIQGAGGGADALMTFHRPGAYATNFGLGNDNTFRWGGWSAGVNWYRFWTEAQCGWPVSDGRLVLVGDSGLGTPPIGGDYVVELWPGAVMTAWKMSSIDHGDGGYTNAINGFRIRYMQLKTSGWYTIGYSG